jgi:hypothetical protein
MATFWFWGIRNPLWRSALSIASGFAERESLRWRWRFR